MGKSTLPGYVCCCLVLNLNLFDKVF